MLDIENGTHSFSGSTPVNRSTAVLLPVAHTTPHMDSSRLLSGGRELVIDHAGQEYRLRLTRNDKLILTK